MGFHNRSSQMTVWFLFLFFIYGCSSGISAPLPETSIPTNPLPDSALPTSTQEPVSSVQTVLTAHEQHVTLSGVESSEEELGKNEMVTIPLGEGIKLDDSGRGVLLFDDRHEIDIFGKTEIQIDAAKIESGGSMFVRIKQIAGHIHVLLDEHTVARLTLETNESTITTLEQGTEFIICYAPKALTCITVQEGAIEVTSENEERIYRKGDATYYKPGDPPQPPICIQEDELRDWLTRKWGPGETEALGDLVQTWPQEPCASSPTAGPSEAANNLPQPEGMVQIEAGRYEIGSSQPDEFHQEKQEIRLGEFWIDMYEVTNADYQRYLDAASQSPPVVWPAADEHPVRGVSWDEALAYCKWLNKRLPTEAEWEVAGRGPGTNPPLFPWGNNPGADGAVNDLPRDDTYEVGTAPFNVSKFGVYDMAGNVWEWVDEPYAPVAEGYHILRGGRHGLLRDMAYRQVAESNNERFVPFAGFRCAAGMVQGE